MTRSDVMASSRPRTERAAQMRKGSPSALRRLALLLPALLLLAVALAAPSAALAQEPTSGYKQKPPTPSTGTSPSKEAAKPAPTPAKETVPAKTSVTPAPETKTLPFTGFDLRWSVALGLLLMCAGLSIVGMQRRQRRRTQR
jgi:hypothetical protein